MRGRPHLAPSIRAAFEKIIARDPSESEVHGRFWDSGSESECEDLGDADCLAGIQQPKIAQVAATPVINWEVRSTTPPPAIGKQANTKPGKDNKPPGIRWPWTKPWKGPLPKKQPSKATLGDYLRPLTSDPDAAVRRLAGDPVYP